MSGPAEKADRGRLVPRKTRFSRDQTLTVCSERVLGAREK